MRKDGVPSVGVDSGSCKQCSALLPGACLKLKQTWMYSITLSSPNSRRALYLVAGKAFGVMFSSVRLRLFVMFSDAIETVRS